MKLIVLTILLLLSINLPTLATTENVDSVDILRPLFKKDSTSIYKKPYNFRLRQLILPTVLIALGTFGTGNDWMEYQNKAIREELQENIDKKLTIDDFSQYAPMASVYALNLCGVKGLHNFRDRTIILGTAYALMMVTVTATKNIIKIRRPDNSSNNSFPSGHTATAFLGAEFLWHEYYHVSKWIGFTGYIVAAGTGFLRMYNNRHWITDVVAGAGVGILSAKAAYWLYPFVNKKIFGKNTHTSMMPIVSPQQKGLYCSITF